MKHFSDVLSMARPSMGKVNCDVTNYRQFHMGTSQ